MALALKMRQALGPGALGRPRGIWWRGRWEGRIGMGNTCKPMADSFQCMAKTTTIKKKMGWDGEGGGWGVQDGEHMYTHG